MKEEDKLIVEQLVKFLIEEDAFPITRLIKLARANPTDIRCYTTV